MVGLVKNYSEQHRSKRLHKQRRNNPGSQRKAREKSKQTEEEIERKDFQSQICRNTQSFFKEQQDGCIFPMQKLSSMLQVRNERTKKRKQKQVKLKK